MGLLNWFVPLDTCTTLDQIRHQWERLLEDHSVVGSSEDLRYHDAVLSFLACSALPANLKLVAVFACVSEFDFDLRLALGLLNKHLDRYEIECTDDRPMLFANCIEIPSENLWLLGYVHGRLIQVQTALRRSSDPNGWETRFWNEFLAMSCRWADKDGVQLALQHGAQVRYNGWASLVATVEGAHAHALRTPYYTEGRTNADYRDILQLLVAAGGVDLPAVSHIVLPAAAAVDNVDMLDELLSHGVDISTAGAAALQAAASNFAASAVDWVLAMGVNVDADGNAALLGAIASLNESLVETLLEAGADVNAGDARPLCMAAAAQPADLFNGEGDFIGQRADMIALLLQSGANAKHPAFAAVLNTAPNGREVLELLTEHETPDDDTQVLFRTLLAAMPAAERA